MNKIYTLHFFAVILMITMLMSFFGVLVARISLKGMWWILHLKGKLRYVFFALWLPALQSIIGGAHGTIEEMVS